MTTVAAIGAAVAERGDASFMDARFMDARYMAAALALGRRGLGSTAPNPSVGALVVRDGIVVGRGVTQPGGRPHGEIVALGEAGEAARGATLYVTLEPCSHHGRTPPCCEAVVAAGITRVVYAIEDPNPLVAGQGVAYLRAQGLAVTGGVCAPAARRDHIGHICRMTAQRPAVTLKLAETADRFVAGGPHDPRLAITGAAANGAVHVMRSMHDAIMIGIGTAQADDPLMTVRLPGVDRAPLRIVVDPRLDISPHSRLLQTASDAPVLLLCGETALRDGGPALRACTGVEIEAVALDADGRVDLACALRTLAERGLTRVFSEGGPTVGSALIRQGLADEVLIVTAPRPHGGSDGVATLQPGARDLLDQSYDLVADYRVGIDRFRHHVRSVACSPV